MAVIVGVDGSEQSRKALRWAIDEASLRGERVVAMTVYGLPPAYYPHGVPGSADTELVERIRDVARVALDKIVAEARADADGVRVAIDAEAIEHPQPAWALIDRAGEDDMLVVGSRGLGGFRGLLLGSVSQQCVQHARCPVVVIRQDR